MSTSLAIATIANANAAAASAAADRAAKTACQAFMQTYQAAGASIERMQYYAGCVHRIYPSDNSPESVLIIKIFLIILLITPFVGVAWQWRKQNRDGMELAFGAFMAPMIFVLIALLCGGIFAAVSYIIR